MPTIFIDYLPAQLRENKRWYIEFYVKDPATDLLQRKIIKINRIKSISERRKFGKRMVSEINRKLENGWNPIIEQESTKSYHNIYEVFDMFINVKGRELRDQSMRSYRSNMNILKEFLIKKDPEKKMYVLSFTRATANDFMNYMYLERGVAERRFNGMLIFCKTLFLWLVQYDYIKANPFNGIKKKKEKAKFREVIPPEIRNKIKKHLEETDLEFLVFLLIEFYALLRPNEILNLKIKDIDVLKHVIIVNEKIAKNAKLRIATIPDTLAEYLKKLQLESYNEELYVFSDKMKPGKNLKLTKYAGRRWLKLRRDLRLPKEYQMYSLRDTGIINLLQSGVSPEEVAKQAAHSSLEILSIYALHANKKANEEIVYMSKEF